ncbi:ROK family protein [Deinococcus roseus]|uniref:Sugar kinase n=1 Tax=Deinococcus roseus TaxID=392414 RepID=A0ABQ2D640_9DEIO|nr:ROK family protein [Deinococcus roseus]GGJ47410.1 sugar kinase [Deinococcus roseus]
MRSQKANANTVRSVNRTLLLNLLRREGSLSRVQLKDLTGLSGAAITGVVAELIGEGVVMETTPLPSSGGRPPVLLTINYKSRAAIGVKLMERELTAVLTDAGANIEASVVLPLSAYDPQTVVDHIAQVVEVLLQKTGRPRSELLGVGIGMAGLIDHETGTCINSPYLKWNHVPIARMVEEQLSLQAIIDNDVNAFAAAERLFGEAINCNHFFVVTVGRGIGSGLVLSGQTYRGFSGTAGEFGHVTTEPGGRICECGKRGCLEAYASDVSLLARYRELKPEVQSLEGMVEAFHEGEPIAMALIEDAGKRIGVALANVVNLLNPQLIVIGGEGIRLPGRYFEQMEQHLRLNVYPGLNVDLDIRTEHWGDEGWARGAASLVLQSTFDFSLGHS